MTQVSLYVQVTWEEAVQACSTKNSYLASITSQEERRFAWKLAGKTRTWIGGSDKTTEGKWEWVDNEPWTPFWNSNQPDNAGNNQDCAQLAYGDDGLFDDNWCTTKYQFICKIQKKRVPTARCMKPKVCKFFTDVLNI